MLTFNYGLMGSGKSLYLIAVYNNLVGKGKYKVGVCVPVVNKDEPCEVSSRASVKLTITNYIYPDSNLIDICNDYDFILIDEVQFCSTHQIDQLRKIADIGKQVICFGLLTNWKLEMFSASKRLVELCNDMAKVEQKKNKCQLCNQRVAIGHCKTTKDSTEEIQVDKNIYQWVCFTCSIAAPPNAPAPPSESELLELHKRVLRFQNEYIQ